MLCIGLTGGSGSGKSTVTQIFASLGAKTVDADAVYHSLIAGPSPCVSELSCTFGKGILSPNGGVDRKRLAEIVFEKTEEGKERLLRLNSITHRYVQKECERLLAAYRQAGESIVVFDVPLLFQSGFDALCDYTVAVLASENVRLMRIMARDSIDRSAAARRLAAQPAEEYYRSRADFILTNEGDLNALTAEVRSILERMR